MDINFQQEAIETLTTHASILREILPRVKGSLSRAQEDHFDVPATRRPGRREWIVGRGLITST
jgi:hypothetical protein